jgi:hypothetical protein
VVLVAAGCLEIGVCEQPRGMAHMIEDQQRIAEEVNGLGHAQRIVVWDGHGGLETRRSLIREVADRAAGKARQVGHGCDGPPLQLRAHGLQRIRARRALNPSGARTGQPTTLGGALVHKQHEIRVRAGK